MRMKFVVSIVRFRQQQNKNVPMYFRNNKLNRMNHSLSQAIIEQQIYSLAQ